MYQVNLKILKIEHLIYKIGYYSSGQAMDNELKRMLDDFDAFIQRAVSNDHRISAENALDIPCAIIQYRIYLDSRDAQALW